jgi:ribonucleoside-diphosphate reductase beta chain
MDLRNMSEEQEHLDFSEEIKERVHIAVDWTKADELTERFWLQNLKQFWRDEEFVPSEDIKPYARLEKAQKWAFNHALGGLTLLDTKQANVGMPSISNDYSANEHLVRRSLLNFMGAMEGIHAKSYSTIFTTLLTKQEIAEVFDWVQENKFLQYKAELIESYYERPQSPYNNYMRKVASVFLESFLFYSGFYYPLYLAGGDPATMTNSAEIIALIIRDEAIHGALIGMYAQEEYATLTAEEREQADAEVYELLEKLMVNEDFYTTELYAELGLDADVKRFLRYNANQALMNLGFEQKYSEEETEFSATVFNGIDTSTIAHDFFSQKGNGYFLGNLVPITDKAFEYEIEDEFYVGY